jgi:hypothetical protein
MVTLPQSHIPDESSGSPTGNIAITNALFKYLGSPTVTAHNVRSANCQDNSYCYLVDMSPLLIDSLFGVKGYVAVVTGGASGLGFMIAKVSGECVV